MKYDFKSFSFGYNLDSNKNVGLSIVKILGTAQWFKFINI